MMLVSLLQCVDPGVSFLTPCLLQLQHQNHSLRLSDDKVPSYFFIINASDDDSNTNEDHKDKPERLLQHVNPSNDEVEEASSTTMLSRPTNTSPSEEITSKQREGFLVPIIDSLLSLKKELYAKLRDVLTRFINIITRSLTKTENWVRNDATGQLISSALALVTFFIGVALFAAWNIQLLGGKKWSGPTEVIVPTIRAPTSTVIEGGGSIKVQRAKWKRPIIQTSYKIREEVQ